MFCIGRIKYPYTLAFGSTNPEGRKFSVLNQKLKNQKLETYFNFDSSTSPMVLRYRTLVARWSDR